MTESPLLGTEPQMPELPGLTDVRVYIGYPPHEAKVYEMDGRTAESRCRPLDPRLELVNHSPTGFSWGYTGSGPAQLALAILADCAGDDIALRHYQSFKFDFVGGWPGDRGWELTDEEIRSWLRGRGERV